MNRNHGYIARGRHNNIARAGDRAFGLPCHSRTFLAGGRDVSHRYHCRRPRDRDDWTLSRALSVDDSSNGKTVHVASGDAILVQLDEPDPDQTWHYSGDDGFKVVSDVVLQMYPARHDFRVKALRPGDLRFNKVDRRDGFVVGTFSIRVSLDQGNPTSAPRKSHPLQMLRTISPGMNAFRFWH